MGAHRFVGPREVMQRLGGQTPQEMLASGQWVKDGKCYRHESGAQACKVRGGWEASTQPGRVWSRLWVAAQEIEKDVAGHRRF